MATSDEISGFAGGAVLYQFGFTGVQRMFLSSQRLIKPRKINSMYHNYMDRADISPGGGAYCRFDIIAESGLLQLHPCDAVSHVSPTFYRKIWGLTYQKYLGIWLPCRISARHHHLEMGYRYAHNLIA
jgi:hypothetical protein